MAETPNLGVTELTEGQSQKEVTINTGFEVFDKAIAGRLVKDVAGAGDVTLTELEWQATMLEFTGALTGARNIIVPTTTRRFSAFNNTTGAFPLTIKTATGTGVEVPQTERFLLEQTGTDVVPVAGGGGTGGGGDSLWSRQELGDNTLLTGLLACWDLEEASGNRLDAVGTNHLTPQGTVATITNAPGKIGQALAMNGTGGTHLSVPDNPTLSAGPNTSITVACWVWLADTANNMGFIGKGSASPTSDFVEYLLWQYNGAWHFMVGNGAGTFVNCTSTFTPVINQWCLLIGWYDHVADLQFIQVNNGTPNQIANALGSYDSGLPLEVGRTVGIGTQSLNGRLDMPFFWKRILTAQERADLWNNSNGMAHPFAQPSQLTTTTPGDQVLLGTTALTQERLEVQSGIKVGNSTGTVDGIIRWTGTDLEVRKGGAWVSLTT